MTGKSGWMLGRSSSSGHVSEFSLLRLDSSCPLLGGRERPWGSSVSLAPWGRCLEGGVLAPGSHTACFPAGLALRRTAKG